MRTNLLIISFVFAFSVSSAQDISTSANGLKSEKQLKKEKKEAEKNLQYIAAGSFLDSLRYVLEADYLSDSRGYRSMVSSILNYISVDSLKGAIQTGNNMGFGSNGVGGATAKGTISGYKLTKNDKKKSFSIKFNLSSNFGFYSVFIDVYADLKASARLNGMGPGSLTFDGYIVPLKKSRVYRASSRY